MNSWLKPVRNSIALNNPFVLLSVIETKGSTPVAEAIRLSLLEGSQFLGVLVGAT